MWVYFGAWVAVLDLDKSHRDKSVRSHMPPVAQILLLSAVLHKKPPHKIFKHMSGANTYGRFHAWAWKTLRNFIKLRLLKSSVIPFGKASALSRTWLPPQYLHDALGSHDLIMTSKAANILACSCSKCRWLSSWMVRSQRFMSTCSKKTGDPQRF